MDKEQLIEFENRIRELWNAGKIRTPHHFCGGNEEILIAYFKRYVRPHHWVFSTHRNAYHWLLHTGDPEFLINQIRNGNSMHIIDISRRFVSSAIVGGNVGPAVGVAKALQISGDDGMVHCFVGDGACDQGWFWEAHRYALGWDLPIKFIIENNNRSVCTDVATRWGPRDKFLTSAPDYRKVYFYSYAPTYPHCGDGRPIEW